MHITSVNTNWIFEKFEKHLPKFCDIETSVSTVYFSKNPEIMFSEFYFLKNLEKFGKYFPNFGLYLPK
jgi:hypothetical protein